MTRCTARTHSCLRPCLSELLPSHSWWIHTGCHMVHDPDMLSYTTDGSLHRPAISCQYCLHLLPIPVRWADNCTAPQPLTPAYILQMAWRCGAAAWWRRCTRWRTRWTSRASRPARRRRSAAHSWCGATHRPLCHPVFCFIVAGKAKRNVGMVPIFRSLQPFENQELPSFPISM